MNKIQKRFFYFLLMCIPLRIYLIYLAKNIKKKENKLYLLILMLVFGLGMLIVYLGGYRKTGAEVGGDEIWWDYMRPMHIFIYLYFSYLYYNNHEKAYEILIYDVVIGLISFTIFHYNNNSFSKLF
tara:strand:- start:211 stop:588 length:378 start_codon:yes stop_codon:yes gene_type:complete